MSYAASMGRSIHVRLDDLSETAMTHLHNCGMTDSEAVRTALMECAASRATPQAIRAEMEQLAADEADVANSLDVLRFMESLEPADQEPGA
jgi:antitoxin component of RelBE/YafQ-DinJ toxin-antitoxin module